LSAVVKLQELCVQNEELTQTVKEQGIKYSELSNKFNSQIQNNLVEIHEIEQQHRMREEEHRKIEEKYRVIEEELLTQLQNPQPDSASS
jgi:hypothetical protein